MVIIIHLLSIDSLFIIHPFIILFLKKRIVTQHVRLISGGYLRSRVMKRFPLCNPHQPPKCTNRSYGRKAQLGIRCKESE